MTKSRIELEDEVAAIKEMIGCRDNPMRRFMLALAGEQQDYKLKGMLKSLADAEARLHEHNNSIHKPINKPE